MKDVVDDSVFGGAEGVDGDGAALADAGVGEGHAPSVFLGDEVGGDEMVFDGEGGGVGEEGGGVAVFADAEHDEVEGMAFDEGFVVGGGGGEGRFFGLHAEDLVRGDGEKGKTALHGGVKVAVWMGRGDGALIAPEERDFRPVEGVGLLREEAVDRVWRRAARESDRKSAAGFDGMRRLVDPVPGGKGDGFFGGGADGEVAPVVEGAL